MTTTKNTTIETGAARRRCSSTAGVILASALTVTAVAAAGCSASADAEGPVAPSPAVAAGFSEPVAGTVEKISTTFSDHDPSRNRGMDIAAEEGTPIYAMADGTVSKAGDAVGYGAWVVIDHDGASGRHSTVYAHMYPEDILVDDGDEVTAGEQIASVGNSGQSAGPHVHVELVDGHRLEATSTQIDPMTWINKATDTAEEQR